MSDAKSIVRHVIDRAWNCGDLETLNTIVAPNYIRKFPGGQVSGPEGFKRRIADTRTALPDFRSEIDDLLEENGTGFVRWTATGTHTGVLAGILGTGRRIQWSGMTWFRVVDVQLVEDWELYDRLDFIQKLCLGESGATKRRGGDIAPG